MNLRRPPGVFRVHSLLLLAVFLVFLCNALGLFSVSRDVAGIDINGQLVRDILDGRSLAPLLRPDFLVFLGTGAGLTLALPLLSPVAASMLTFAAMLPPFYVAWTFPLPPPQIPMEYTLLTTLVLFAVNVLVCYFIETHERQKLIAAFSHYVPPTLVAEINRNPLAFSMAGQARELSVLFCDIKNFSYIAEHLEPESLAELLNLYLTEMTAVLHRHGATIDKYIGDAVMAFWGAPLQQHDHARRAVAAALAMQARMTQVRADCARRGWPELTIGIGINSGMMSVGNMGSRFRVAYTVLGDAVNLAARLEALTRYYGTGILIGDATRAACTDVACRELDHVRVKGKGHATRVYEPLPAVALDSALEASHQGALNVYYAGAWGDARVLFTALRDGAAAPRYYEVMLARMQGREPPANWDGIVSFGGEFSYSLEPFAPGT